MGEECCFQFRTKAHSNVTRSKKPTHSLACPLRAVRVVYIFVVCSHCVFKTHMHAKSAHSIVGRPATLPATHRETSTSTYRACCAKSTEDSVHPAECCCCLWVCLQVVQRQHNLQEIKVCVHTCVTNSVERVVRQNKEHNIPPNLIIRHNPVWARTTL